MRTISSILDDLGKKNPGITGEQINEVLSYRLIDPNTIKTEADLMREVPFTINEFVEAEMQSGSSIKDIQMNLASRGLWNIENLTDAQGERPIPAQVQNADQDFVSRLTTFDGDSAIGHYRDWKWDDSKGALARSVFQRKIDSLGGGGEGETEVYLQWLKDRDSALRTFVTDRGFGASESAFSSRNPEPQVSEGAKRSAGLRHNLETALHRAKVTGGLTGFATSLYTGMRDMFQVMDAPGGKYIDSPKGKQHLKDHEKQLRLAGESLMELIDEDAAGIDDPENFVTWFEPKGKEQKKRFERLEHLIETGQELRERPLHEAFSEYFFKDVPDAMKINHKEIAYKSGQHMAKVRQGKLNDSLTKRSKDELVELLQGFSILFDGATTVGRDAVRLAQMVEKGIANVDDAELQVFLKAYQGGGGAFGGLAGFYSALGDHEQSVIDHARAYPIDTALWMLPVLHLAKGARVAYATKGIKQVERHLRAAGVSEDTIKAARAVKLQEAITGTNTVLLRQFFESPTGKGVQSKMLKFWGKGDLPEILTTGVKVGAVSYALDADLDETLLLAGGAAGLKSLGTVILGNSRMRRITHDLAAQSTESGEGVTRALFADLMETEGVRAATAQLGEHAIRQGERFDGTVHVDDAIVTDFVARAESAVEGAHDVVVTRGQWVDATAGTPEKAAARAEYLNARRVARADYLENTQAVLPEPAYIAAISRLKEEIMARQEGEFIPRLDAMRDAHKAELAGHKERAIKARGVDLDDAIDSYHAANREMANTRKSLDAELADAEVLAEGRYIAERDKLRAQRAERGDAAGARSPVIQAEIKKKKNDFKKRRADARRKSKAEMAEISARERKVKAGEGRKPRKEFKELRRIEKARLEAQIIRLNEAEASIVKTLEASKRKVERRAGRVGVIHKRKKMSYNDARRQLAVERDEAVARAREYHGAMVVQAEAKQTKALSRVSEATGAEARATEAAVLERRVDGLSPDEIERHRMNEDYKRREAAVYQESAEHWEAGRKALQEIQNLRAAQYTRARQSAAGLHIDDGQYVFKVVKTVQFDSAIPGDAKGMFRSVKLTDNELADPALINRRVGGGDTPYGYIEPTELRWGSVVDQAMAFPSGDIPEILKLIRDVGNISIEGVEGVKQLSVLGDTVEAVSAALRKGDTVAIDKAINKIKGSTFAGREALRRLTQDVLTDTLLNKYSHGILLDAGLKKRFAAYVADKVTERLAGVGQNITKSHMKRLKSELQTMAYDFSQARTMGGGSIARVDYDIRIPGSKKGRLRMEDMFIEFMDSKYATPVMIQRARTRAFNEALFVVTSAAEHRRAVDVVLGQIPGMTRELWEAGASDIAHRTVMYKYALKHGQMPQFFRGRALKQGGPHPLSPTGITENVDLLRALVADPAANPRRFTFEQAAQAINNDLRAERTGLLGAENSYVQLGSSLDPSNLPNLERIGAGPTAEAPMGLRTLHSPLQPEHMLDAVSGFRGEAMSDIFIRSEYASAIGGMLNTHDYLTGGNAIIQAARALGVTFKWTKTAGNPVNHMTNFSSNYKTWMLDHGFDPATAGIKIAQGARMWGDYTQGLLKGTRNEAWMDAIMRQGVPSQSLLISEIDDVLLALQHNGPSTAAFSQSFDDLVRGGKIPRTDIEVPGMKWASENLDRAYRTFGDELFKRLEAHHQMGIERKYWDSARPGTEKWYWDLSKGGVDSDAAPLGSIRALRDGSYEVSYKGKVTVVDDIDAPRNPAMELMAHHGVGRGNAKYYNLADVGLGVKVARQLESIMIPPFISWFIKSLDIPFLKRGMFHRTFVNRMSTMTNSPMDNFASYWGESKTAARRAILTSAAKDHQDDFAALRRILPTWARHAVFGDDMEFLLGDSSYPFSGMLAFMETLDSGLSYATESKGKGLFLASARRETYSPMHLIRTQAGDMFKGGAVGSILQALSGKSTITNRSLPDDEYWPNFVRTMFPGYASHGTRVVGQIAQEFESLLEYDVMSMGKRTTMKQMRNGDKFVGIMNALIARRMRKADILSVVNVITNMPTRLVDQMVADIEEKKLFESGSKDEIQDIVEMYTEAIEAYGEYIPRLSRFLKRQGTISKNAKLNLGPYEKKLKAHMKRVEAMKD